MTDWQGRGPRIQISVGCRFRTNHRRLGEVVFDNRNGLDCWYVAKAVFPDEVRHLQFFLTFIVVIIPFVMLIYFGSAIIIYDAITAPPWPTALPLKLSSGELLAAALKRVSEWRLRQLL